LLAGSSGILDTREAGLRLLAQAGGIFFSFFNLPLWRIVPSLLFSLVEARLLDTGKALRGILRRNPLLAGRAGYLTLVKSKKKPGLLVSSSRIDNSISRSFER
jgi:hypothetical protein